MREKMAHGESQGDDAQSRSWNGEKRGTEPNQPKRGSRVEDEWCWSWEGRLFRMLMRSAWPAPRQKLGGQPRPSLLTENFSLTLLRPPPLSTVPLCLTSVPQYRLPYKFLAHTVSRPHLLTFTFFTIQPLFLPLFSAHPAASEPCFCRCSCRVPTHQDLAVAINRLETASLTTRGRPHHATCKVTRF